MKIGFIGAGNMATAILTGMLRQGAVKAGDIGISDPDPAKVERLIKSQGIGKYDSNAQLIEATSNGGIVFLCVKPQIAPAVFAEIAPLTGEGVRIVSIVAGWSGEKLRQNVKSGTQILRVMPNTPLLVGQGMVAFEDTYSLDAEHYDMVKAVFESMGTVLTFPPEQMEMVTAVSGCGPAYGYMFIDMLARAGEKAGLAYDNALTLAAQTVKGAAQMIQTTGDTPAHLTQLVCSPGGSTIEGVHVIEASDMAAVLVCTVAAAKQRSEELGK